MQVIELKNKELWNDFISAQKYTQFLQSWEWGEFHKKMGRKVWRIAMLADENCEILMVAQIIKYKLPFRQSYLYCPRGPTISQKLTRPNASGGREVESQKLWNIFFRETASLARKEKSMFLRFEPMEEIKIGDVKINKVKSVQPKNEWLLNLEKVEGELLKEMQQKTRYNIRLAEKKGVKLRTADGNDDFDKFWDLISDTYNRKQIRTHSKEYYKGILEIGRIVNHHIKNSGVGVKLWLAEYQGKVIATNIISYFGDTAIYMHGGADYEMRNFMSPYFLQWEAIKDAKDKGYSYYNFGGVSETNTYWQGITRFKKGFGGFELDYKGTYEISFSKEMYWIYKIIKRFKNGNS